MRIRLLFAVASILALAVTWGDDAQGLSGREEVPIRWREPSALSASEDGRWLYVAQRAGGSISVIDTTDDRVSAEVEVGQALADLIALPDGRLLAVDEIADELLILRAEGPELRVLDRVEVPQNPVVVRASADGRRGFLSSLWSRRLTLVDLEPGQGGEARVFGSVDLPFCPRSLLVVEDGSKVIVADAFGGGLAVVDADALSLDSVRTLPGHNLRGLALSADGQRVLIAQQVLNRNARTDLNDIHWGAFITNNLRSLPLSAVLDPSADPLREGIMHQLGDVGNAAGDPSGLAVISKDRVAVALGGVGEVGVGPEHAAALHRIRSGKRPLAMLAAPDGSRLYVANALSDTITIVDPEAGERLGEIPLGPTPEPSRAQVGEELFFDARLSHDGWMSCHSCHTDGHTNGLLADTLGDDSYGAPKRIMSLLGTGETGPWAWDGSMPSLEEQVRKSIRTTMRGNSQSNIQVDAIATFLRTLNPPPPPPSQVDPDAVARGAEIFQDRGCQRCHAPPELTTPMIFEVGFLDELGNSEFNPPSLRGVGQRDRFLHDGRAWSLEEVFQKFGHPNSSRMTDEERADLIAFLKGL
ncbi:hypothetical protein BH23PLA1_BH23PLA1_08840 [soil metagenome]